MTKEWYINYYRCETCGYEWFYGDTTTTEEVECPTCGAHKIKPYNSESI